MELGTVEQADGRVTFRYERRLRHPVEVVWRAITDPGEIARWAGMEPELELRPGGQYVTHHQGGQRVVDRVARVEPPRLFEHTFWEHVNPSALVTWELGPIPEGTRLALTHSMSMEDVERAVSLGFGDDPATIIARNGAGWHRLLDRLAGHLDGAAEPWSPKQQRELTARYAELVAG